MALSAATLGCDRLNTYTLEAVVVENKVLFYLGSSGGVAVGGVAMVMVLSRWGLR